MNPCPCGYLGHFSGRCRCGADAIARYRARISGPLLDRIDLHVDVPALLDEDYDTAARGEASRAVRERVCKARDRQLHRQGVANARLGSGEIEERARPDGHARRMLRDATSRLGLSARAHHRLLKVARTLADLDDCARVGEAHLGEALRYRGARGTGA
jgi:magnesium chelatase family protein